MTTGYSSSKFPVTKITAPHIFKSCEGGIFTLPELLSTLKTNESVRRGAPRLSDDGVQMSFERAVSLQLDHVENGALRRLDEEVARLAAIFAPAHDAGRKIAYTVASLGSDHRKILGQEYHVEKAGRVMASDMAAYIDVDDLTALFDRNGFMNPFGGAARAAGGVDSYEARRQVSWVIAKALANIAHKNNAPIAYFSNGLSDEHRDFVARIAEAGYEAEANIVCVPADIKHENAMRKCALRPNRFNGRDPEVVFAEQEADFKSFLQEGWPVDHDMRLHFWDDRWQNARIMARSVEGKIEIKDLAGFGALTKTLEIDDQAAETSVNRPPPVVWPPLAGGSREIA